MASPDVHIPDPDRADRPVVAIAIDYDRGGRAAFHVHRRAQLLFVVRGALRLETEAGLWLVPPGHAAWVPGGLDHAAEYTERSAARVAYFDGDPFPDLPAACSVFALTGLLRALVERVVALGWAYPTGGSAERLVRVLVDEIVEVRAPGRPLPLGRDPRLRRVTEALLADPGDSRRLAEWAGSAGAGERTLARLFRTETGWSFAGWRERLRLTRAVELLAAGRDVTRTALDLGYAAPSSFTTMFTRAMGRPPRAWLADLDRD